jgi:hypothetical protein
MIRSGTTAIQLNYLENNNVKISAQTEALNVSNYVTTDQLPANSAFAATNLDPDNFRLEVYDVTRSALPGYIKLEVIRNGSLAVGPIAYTLSTSQSSRFRSEFIRLVTDPPDDAVAGRQTVLSQLDDLVRMTYTPFPGYDLVSIIRVGRPVSENNNDPANQRRHDIRELSSTSWSSAMWLAQGLLYHAMMFSRMFRRQMSGLRNRQFESWQLSTWGQARWASRCQQDRVSTGPMGSIALEWARELGRLKRPQSLLPRTRT